MPSLPTALRRRAPQPLKLLLAGAALALALATPAEAGKVVLLATGGTIAGKAEGATTTSTYKTSQLSADQLIRSVPGIADLAEIEAHQILNVGSENITDAMLLTLYEAVRRHIARSDVDGIVILHGTDTLEETAFFLDLVLDTDKPVVLTGAQRPATAISADGPMNIAESVSVAAGKASRGRGVLVVMNDQIASGFYVTKTNTATLDAFRAEKQGYLGTIVDLHPIFYYAPARPTGARLTADKVGPLPKVEIIYAHQGMSGALMDAAIAAGARGIVIAGVGNGWLPASLEPAIAAAERRGIPVVRSTRTGSGFVSEKQPGIASGLFNPQKSRLLLALALAQGSSLATIRDLFGASRFSTGN